MEYLAPLMENLVMEVLAAKGEIISGGKFGTEWEDFMDKRP